MYSFLIEIDKKYYEKYVRNMWKMHELINER